MQATNFQAPPHHRSDVDLRVVDHPNLIKRGAAVVNTDTASYRAALARREAANKSKAEMDNLKSRIDKMEAMLQQILEAVNGKK